MYISGFAFTSCFVFQRAAFMFASFLKLKWCKDLKCCKCSYVLQNKKLCSKCKLTGLLNFVFYYTVCEVLLCINAVITDVVLTWNDKLVSLVCGLSRGIMQVIASVSSDCCKLVWGGGRIKTELSFLKRRWKQVIKWAAASQDKQRWHHVKGPEVAVP